MAGQNNPTTIGADTNCPAGVSPPEPRKRVGPQIDKYSGAIASVTCHNQRRWKATAANQRIFCRADMPGRIVRRCRDVIETRQSVDDYRIRGH